MFNLRLKNLSRQVFDELPITRSAARSGLFTHVYPATVVYISSTDDAPQCICEVHDSPEDGTDSLFFPVGEKGLIANGLNGASVLPLILGGHTFACGDSLLLEVVRDVDNRLMMSTVHLVLPGDGAPDDVDVDDDTPLSDRTGDVFRPQGTMTGRSQSKTPNMKPAKASRSIVLQNVLAVIENFLPTAKISMGYPPKDKSPQRAIVGERFDTFVDACMPSLGGFTMPELLDVPVGELRPDSGVGISKKTLKALKELSPALAHWLITGKKK